MTCPRLVTSGIPTGSESLGLSDDGSTLYEVDSDSVILYSFPAFGSLGTVDLNPAMNTLGASSDGSILSACLGPDGYLYCAADINDSLRLFSVLPDGTDPTLLWDYGITVGSFVLVDWHPADADYIYMVHFEETTPARVIRKIHRTTGTATTLDTVPAGPTSTTDSQQYDGGFVFYDVFTDTIFAFDIAAANLGSHSATDITGLGVSPEGTIYWINSSNVTEAIEVTSGPTFTVVTGRCANPWYVPADTTYGAPYGWFATANRSRVYLHDSFYLWRWGGRWFLGKVGRVG